MAKKSLTPQPEKALDKLSREELLEYTHNLQDSIRSRDDYIVHLERLTEAYENLKTLSERELKDADSVIQAQEILQNLMTQERIHAEKIIHAHELVEQLSAQEIDEARRIIEAQEVVQGMMSRERIDAERIIQAHEIVESLSAREIEDAYKTIEAHERIHGLARSERQGADQELLAREKVSNLSSVELKHRDQDLLRVLEINRGISAILDEEELMHRIVTSLAQSLEADRSGIFWLRDSRLVPISTWKVKPEDLEKPAFQAEMELVHKCKDTCLSQMLLNHTVSGGKSRKEVNIIAVPLMQQDTVMGVLYAAKNGPDKTFYSRDQFTAEIFALQAVISLNNANLYKKVRKQNWELLRLINLKNEFISRLSQHIMAPCQELDNKLTRIEQCQCESCAKNIKDSRGITRKLTETVQRVLNLVEMEKEVDDLTATPIDFNHVIESLLHKYHSELERKKIKIKTKLCEEFSHYPGNETIIRAILDELIGNAILYNHPEGKVEVTGSMKGEYLELRIKDDGPGIPLDEQELIFEQFYRSDSTRALNESGAGLGLYMVRSFMTYYHGKLDLVSEPGKGATFILHLLST